MKTNLHILPSITILATVCGLLAACSGKKEQDHSNLPKEVEPVAIAIIEDSAPKFAQSVYYPLERPYPLKTIEDSAEMVKYYPTMIDDSLKKAVRESPDSLWQQIGWRGWTLGNGSYMWVDSGKVYSVNYVSHRESEMLDSLRKSEIATLEPSMRKGWIPVLCAVDSAQDAIFRIDEDGNVENPVYRLAGYNGECDLSDAPVILLYGTLDTEGTMDTRYYVFEDSTGNSAVYSPDVESDDDTPTLDVTVKGKNVIYHVRPTYWLEQYKNRDRRFHIMPGRGRAAETHVGHAGSLKIDSTATECPDSLQ